MGLTRRKTDAQISQLLQRFRNLDPPLADGGISDVQKRACNRWAIRECDVIRVIRTIITEFHAHMEELGLALYPVGWHSPVASIGSANAQKVVDPMRANAVGKEANRTAVPSYANEREFANRWVASPI